MPRTQASRAIAEGAAARIWARYCIASPSEFDLDDVAARGAYVVEGTLDSADARLVRRGAQGVIRVSSRIAEPGRRRFAVAHELGHFEMHAAVSPLLACTSVQMRGDYRASVPEVEANWFAAELLMPAKLFARQHRHAFPSFEEVSRLAAYFGTSRTAAAVRLVELSDDECAFVASEGGRVRWWRGSERFRERYWIDCGVALSGESAAGAVFAGESPPGGPVQVPAAAWGGAEADEPWWEDVAGAGDYGQIHSLLRPS